MTQHRPSRNPDELLVKDKPIPLRLVKSDRADAERISKTEKVSLSAHARRCYQLGKSILYPKTSSPPKRLKRGGGGNPAPASSLPVA